MASNLLAPIASSNRQVQIVVISIVFVAAISIDLITYLGRYNGPPIRSDGFGYYVYLPALLHGDIFFNFLKDPATWDLAGQYGSVRPGLSNVPQGFLDQYAIGTAVLQMPFFMLALLFQKIRGMTTWGFEPAFQFANAVSAACYLVAGSYILLNSLMPRLSPVAASIFVLVAVLGTNTIMYGSYDGAFSHVYSYFLCCCTVAIVSLPRRELSTEWRRGLALGVVIGLATMVRPTNLIGAPIILLILPARPKDAAWTVAAFSAAFVVSTLPQTAWWMATTGSPISYSYHQEGFDFAHPHLLEFLFSVRKGVFFWCPVYLLLVVTALFAPKERRIEAGVLLLIVAIFYYTCASWDPWAFGGSFGSRPAVDMLPYLVLAASLALPAHIAPPLRLILGALLLALVATNLTQAWGYISQEYIKFDETTWDNYVLFWRSVLHA